MKITTILSVTDQDGTVFDTGPVTIDVIGPTSAITARIAISEAAERIRNGLSPWDED